MMTGREVSSFSHLIFLTTFYCSINKVLKLSITEIGEVTFADFFFSMIMQSNLVQLRCLSRWTPSLKNKKGKRAHADTLG